jgi:hypothetical protein
MSTAHLSILDWNCGQRVDAWGEAASTGADVVLLQEALPIPNESELRVVSPIAGQEWKTGGTLPRPWRTAVATAADVQAEPIPLAALDQASADEVGVSRAGTIAAATVTLPGADPLIVVSVYSPWETPWPHYEHGWIYADASAHRVVSDLSQLVALQRKHRLLIAGDWNILRGYGEDGSPYWAGRYETVFNRLEALGLTLVGPFAGRLPDPWPSELPEGSTTTPTFWPRNGTPSRQLDFVFASRSLVGSIEVTALNNEVGWTADHCKIRIEVDL